MASLHITDIAPTRRQSNRQLKLTCNKCGFICRASAKQIARAPEGLICPIPVCDGDLESAS